MSETEIIKKIISLTKNYDYIYFTSDMRGFLFKREINNIPIFFQNLFVELNKKSKTSIIPSYTYTKNGIFSIYKTKSNLSLLTKWSFNQEKILRSEHPLFSCIGLGNEKKILKDIQKSAFGTGSIFDKLYKNKSCLLHLGRPLEMGNTSIHYVEQMAGASYRKNKLFKTKVYNNKKYIGTNYSVFVRDLSDKTNNYISNTLKISKILKKKKLVKEFGNYKKNTNITILDYKNTIDLMIDEFYKNQRIFIN